MTMIGIEGYTREVEKATSFESAKCRANQGSLGEILRILANRSTLKRHRIQLKVSVKAAFMAIHRTMK